MVVLHYTGMESAAAARARLCDQRAEVSAHWLVDLDGTAEALVPEGRRAWHAGVARWGDVRDVNSRSIGIELVNPGTGPAAHPFPEAQMRALEGLLREIMGRHAVVAERVVGHACVAPGRKADPAAGFDWRRLALAGRAVWLDPAPPAPGRARHRPRPPARAGRARRAAWPAAGAFQEAARRFGYGVPATGLWDAGTLAVWRAFARRFRPWDAEGPPCAEGLARLAALAARWPARLDPGAPAP
jgi:N-acetylmuramoyl-L-alanine amidase